MNKKFLALYLSTLFLVIPANSYAIDKKVIYTKAKASECKTLVKKIFPSVTVAISAPGGLGDLTQAKANSKNFSKVSSLFKKYRLKTKGDMRTYYKDAAKISSKISITYLEADVLVSSGSLLSAQLNVLPDLLELVNEFTYVIQDISSECS